MKNVFYIKISFFEKLPLILKVCAGDKIEKNEMGGTCGTYGGRERCAQGFGAGPEGKKPLGDQDVDWRIILRWILRK